MAKGKKDNGNGKSKVTVTATYDKDSKRFHRYSVGEYGDMIVGNLYIAKNIKEVPDTVVISLDHEREEEE